jgi:hypothetical protein
MGGKIDVLCANGVLERVTIDAFINGTQVFRFDETFRAVLGCGEDGWDAYRFGAYNVFFAAHSYGINVTSFAEKAVEREP